jgi:homopolymeric O-antigen transport system permease protein
MARRQAVLPMGESISQFLDTLRILVAREFRMRYKGSFFGIVWALITPIATAIVLQILFTKVLTLAVPHLATFIYSAILPWTWFQASLQTGSSTISDNRDLVRTPFFSKPLLPWAVTCTNFVLYLIALPVAFGLMAYDGLPFTSALVLLPIIWLVQWILTLAFTVLLAGIGILVRDIQHLITVILVFWFYLTPIFYDLNQISPKYVGWFSLNPMAAIVMAHRDVTLRGRAPDWGALAAVAIAGVAILGLSLAMFRAVEDSFIDQA